MDLNLPRNEAPQETYEILTVTQDFRISQQKILATDFFKVSLPLNRPSHAQFLLSSLPFVLNHPGTLL
jgi:hypothetical protein